MNEREKELLEIIKELLPYVEDHRDEGPEGEGWKSDELLRKIERARNALKAK